MIREYVNNVNATQDTWVATDPYYYIRVDSVNHSGSWPLKYFMGSFTASETVTTSTESTEKFSWYTMSTSSSNSSMTFTKSITLPSEDHYVIELMLNKTTTASKTVYFDLSIDGDSVWSETGYRSWNDHGVVARLPSQFLSAGAHTFVLTVPKYAGAAWFKISRITRYEGGKDLVKDSSTRLDLISCEFTQNGCNSLDYAKVVVAMKPDFWTSELGTNPMAFDVGDSVTIVLGENGRTARPLFGGYVQGWELSDDGTELTIHCIDRLWDLKRTVVWRNFYIGTAPSTTNTGSFSYTQFSTVNQIARYLSTALYEINCTSIEYEYVMANSFSEAGDVTGLSSTGFDLKWETQFGNPGSSLRIIPTALNDNELILWTDTTDTWDATEYNMFSFDYYASGAGVKYPLYFNIEVDMYTTEGDYSDAITYVINFNGDTAVSPKVTLEDVDATLNGVWQRFSIDLESAFEDLLAADNYYISEVRLVGNQPISSVLNRRCSSLYLDNIIAYGSISSAPSYKSADSKTALEELQDLCTKTNHYAYTRPGMERCDDQLLCLPKGHYTIPVIIDETNVIALTGLEYMPLEWGLLNSEYDSYNISGSTTIRYVKAQDVTSDRHYGVVQGHSFYSDVSSKASAQAQCNAKVNTEGFWQPGFDLTIKGNTLLEPGQNLEVKLPKYNMYGVYVLTAIVHKIDFTKHSFKTELEFERPSGKFSNMVAKINKANKDYEAILISSGYDTAGSYAAGMETSLGAYST